MNRMKFCWFLLMTFTLTLCAPALGQRNQPEEKTMDYGGEWWLSRSSIEQRGYIDGDADCYTSLLKGELKSIASTEKVQAFVNQFYEDPTHWPSPVSHVVRTFYSRNAVSHEASSTGSESWNEPHGYWDGLWWKGGTIARLTQLGYVEGYLACYKNEAHSPHGTFSKSSTEYVSLISSWYDRTGKEDTKIADVLSRFRDQLRSPGPRGK